MASNSITFRLIFFFLFLTLAYHTASAMVLSRISHPIDSNFVKPQVGFGFTHDYGTQKSTLENTIKSSLETNKDTSWVRMGGALRLNTIYAIYEGQTFPLGTSGRNEWTWDTWRINVDSYSKGIQFAFEYRFYPTFNTHFVKYGWLGYKFTDNTNLQIGITQVPFGLLTYASHSWWFQAPYYLGLEDNHQIGFNYTHNLGDWDFNFAYFPLSEPRGTSDPAFGPYSSARYSYDVIPVDGNSNIERHQINIRAQRKIENWKLGLSLQHQEIYNQVTTNNGNQLALALHGEWDWSRWNFKSELIYYRYHDVRDDDQQLLSSVQMGAYGFGSYDVASEAVVYLAGIAYSIPVSWGPISNIQVYNDYSLVQKTGSFPIRGVNSPFVATQQNVLGALLTAGKIYTYLDMASGYNHPWISDSFGGNALGPGRGEQYNEPISDQNPIDPTPGWNTRINLNIGYYF
ncbi:hypothetical protein [Echinicola pacifica]|nr:hypothetical protein [Echinicola pacifica]